MSSMPESLVRDQLQTRRRWLSQAIETGGEDPEIHRLLSAVDAALSRLDQGTFGLCKTCGDPIEQDRLAADPLLEFCLDHLSLEEQRALEADMDLASRVQTELLPRRSFSSNGWRAGHVYEPAGPVSGDYCDVLTLPDGRLFFAVGDASGKGVSASLLMAQLHALLRALLPLGLPPEETAARASHVLCESTLPAHYATLACGWASPEGEVTLVNAGHVPPLCVGGEELRWIGATGLPLGLFCDQGFKAVEVALRPGELLVLCTDGLTETRSPSGEEFGRARLEGAARALQGLAPEEVAAGLAAAAGAFRGGVRRADDLTVLVIQRTD